MNVFIITLLLLFFQISYGQNTNDSTQEKINPSRDVDTDTVVWKDLDNITFSSGGWDDDIFLLTPRKAIKSDTCNNIGIGIDELEDVYLIPSGGCVVMSGFDIENIIIGSGAGGSTTAYELLKQQKKCIILEEGPNVNNLDLSNIGRNIVKLAKMETR